MTLSRLNQYALSLPYYS